MFQPSHKPTAEVCTYLVNGVKCGVHASKHRNQVPRQRTDYYNRYDAQRDRAANQDRIIGIDGEGIGRKPHRYTFMAACDEFGQSWTAPISDTKLGRLSTKECLDFILSLPERSLIVGFAFLYDITKILTDLPDESIYKLVHEEERQYRSGKRIVYKPVYWGPYALNYMNRRLTVARGYWRKDTRGRPVYVHQRRATVWDIFRFYQTKFTQSLLDWKVADESRLKWMAEMKDKRSEFDKLKTEDIHDYCKEECTYLAKLARELIDAHKAAGLPLKHYYGAGSTASAFLERIGAKESRGDIPEDMRVPVASAFFGGRFENSYLGPVYQRCFNYDISSAYPYQATFLPCLLCGTWTNSRTGVYDSIARGRLSLVQWHSTEGNEIAWGSLPVRAQDGTIVFPLGAKGGWTWKDEFLAARRLNPNVQAIQAWTYNTDCIHQPFADIPNYYRERIKLGKEGRGIVLKLGTNSIYGKLAQSKGVNPPYQSWVWAGNITSGTRAQLLDAIANVSDSKWNVLMLATDGIWSTSPLNLPLPRDTGTNDTGKPLGGWEEKVFDRGVFCVRPGIYFPLEPTEKQLKEVRARGLGKKILYEQWPRIIEAWEQRKPGIEVTGLQRFVGAKSGIHYSENNGYRRSEDYGDWVEHSVKVTFNPIPKRRSITPTGHLLPFEYLDFESVPYKAALKSPEAEMLALAELIAEEQPDGSFSEL